MKYLLKKDEQDKGVLCDKVTIDGFDYYVSDDAKISTDNLWVISKRTNYLGKTFYPKNDGTVTDNVIKEVLLSVKYEGHYETAVGRGGECDLVIATNNPNIDLPKVVDEVEKFIKKTFYKEDGINFKRSTIGADEWINGFKIGYNKSQSTHPNSDEDMGNYSEWIINNQFTYNGNVWVSTKIHYLGVEYTTQQLLELWKSQQPKIVYYE